MASRKHASSPAVEVATPLPVVDARIDESGAPQDATPALTDIPLIAMPASGPSVTEPDRPAVDGRGRMPEPIDARPGVRRPGIIIRGGLGGNDPCDIHNPRGGDDPRGGVPTVLVNPRVPTGRLPGTPRGGGGIRF
jgi:hypothetical protein